MNSFSQSFPSELPFDPSLPEPSAVYTSYDSLPNYAPNADLNQIAEMIKSRFEDKSQWKGHFDAIDNIRIINKFYPSQLNNIFIAFGSYILEHLDNHKRTNVFRNCLFLMKEIFSNCKEFRLADEIIHKILPILLAKIISEKQIIKEEIKAIFEEISTNCLYESTFQAICGLCFEKNPNVSEAALKILARMMSNLGGNLMNLPQNTLQKVLKTLSILLDERKISLKNANLRNWSVEIANYVYKMVGVENFLNFMNVLLTKEEGALIMMAMEKPILKKESKKSRVSLGDYIKLKRNGANFNGFGDNMNNMN